MMTPVQFLPAKFGAASLFTLTLTLTIGALLLPAQAQEEAEEALEEPAEEQGGVPVEEQVDQVDEQIEEPVQIWPLPEEVDELLQSMSDRLVKAKTFVIEADLLIDEVLDSGLLIQRAATLKLQVQRPNGLRAIMTSDTKERTMWYDGKTMTIADVDDDVHVTVGVPDRIGPALDYFMEHYGVSIALSDFFYDDPYEALTADVVRAHYVGMSQVNSIPCHHLVFFQENIDWQLWIEDGERPIPRKLVIVYKNDPGAPHYTAILKEVKLQDPVPHETFKAVIPESSLRIDLLDLAPDEPS